MSATREYFITEDNKIGILLERFESQVDPRYDIYLLEFATGQRAAFRMWHITPLLPTSLRPEYVDDVRTLRLRNPTLHRPCDICPNCGEYMKKEIKFCKSCQKERRGMGGGTDNE
jgi:hypothetical protein